MRYVGLVAVSRYWHTLRYLKPSQLYWRVRYLLQRPRLQRKVDLVIRDRAGRWCSPVAQQPSMLGPQLVRFLNQEGELPAEGPWTVPDRSLLWHFHLHYFEDLVASHASDRAPWHHQLIAHWFAANPPGQGVGWHPYTLSRRIVNWIKWDLGSSSLTLTAQHSLVLQARWLLQRLEYHLLGNHLLVNAKALVFAGCYFAGSEAEHWLKIGMSVLQRELDEQILTDGGHCERSPMYHAAILEDLLDLINLSHSYPAQLENQRQIWQQRAGAMMHWLLSLSHPDRDIAFFNDASLHGAASPDQLATYMTRLGIKVPMQPACGVTWLAASGYLRWQDHQATLLLDCAPLGPDYQPGHGHADTLSFELSLWGQRILVNSGVSEYGEGEQRLRQRGTAAHNTVVVDEQNSSEVWSGFRVARRASPTLHSLSVSGGSLFVHASHDGYQRLAGRVTHHREWHATTDGLEIRDRLEGRFTSAIAHFYLHPDIQVSGAGHAEGWTLRLASGEQVVLSVCRGKASLESTTWHPEFGKVVANHCVRVRFEGPDSLVKLSWPSSGNL